MRERIMNSPASRFPYPETRIPESCELRVDPDKIYVQHRILGSVAEIMAMALSKMRGF
jgi:hypothetical protein